MSDGIKWFPRWQEFGTMAEGGMFYMLDDPKNADRLSALADEASFRNLLAGGQPDVTAAGRVLSKDYVQKSDHILTCRDATLDQNDPQHANILGKKIGPGDDGLDLRYSQKISIAKVNDDPMPGPDTKLKHGDNIHFGCSICNFSENRCERCDAFVKTQRRSQFALQVFETKYHWLHGVSFGPPVPGQPGVNLNKSLGMQIVGLSGGGMIAKI